MQMVSIFALSAGLTWLLGLAVKDKAHGWTIFACMFLMFVGGFAVVWHAEMQGDPRLAALGVATGPGLMEGKEARFGRHEQRAFCHRHHGRIVWGGERHARQPDAPGRPHPHAEHRIGRGHLRRSGGRALRDDRLRHPGSLPLGPDGGPHAGVPGQEDRRHRSQAGRPGHPGAFQARQSCCSRPWPASVPGAWRA